MISMVRRLQSGGTADYRDRLFLESDSDAAYAKVPRHLRLAHHTPKRARSPNDSSICCGNRAETEKVTLFAQSRSLLGELADTAGSLRFSSIDLAQAQAARVKLYTDSTPTAAGTTAERDGSSASIESPCSVSPRRLSPATPGYTTRREKRRSACSPRLPKWEGRQRCLLLRTRILLRDPYQRQGDNIITWCEPFYVSRNSGGVDLALSFQDNAGCLDTGIWRQITHVQSRASELLRQRNQSTAAEVASQYHAQLQEQDDALWNGEADLEAGFQNAPLPSLPHPPTLHNLEEIADTIAALHTARAAKRAPCDMDCPE